MSQQDEYSDREVKNFKDSKDNVIPRMQNALEFMRNNHYEVPYISNKCKEYVEPELKINHLHRVYKFDEEWTKLQSRKKNLLKLFANCKDYQEQKICADLEAPMPEDIRIVTSEDLEKIQDIATFEELKDWDELYNFYYSIDRDEIKVLAIKVSG